jgi:hypothetical protein
VVGRGGTQSILRARRACPARVPGPSTSPLERSMARQQAPVAAVILGVALAIGLRYSREGLAHLIGPTYGGVLPNWVPLSAAPIQVLVLLAPGFFSGWIASRRELLCGFLTGLLGAVLYQMLTESYVPETIVRGASDVLFRISWLLSTGVSSGLFAAAAAGTAQLLRSNNPWRGP